MFNMGKRAELLNRRAECRHRLVLPGAGFLVKRHPDVSADISEPASLAIFRFFYLGYFSQSFRNLLPNLRPLLHGKG
jgi:hypothetical protein